MRAGGDAGWGLLGNGNAWAAGSVPELDFYASMDAFKHTDRGVDGDADFLGNLEGAVKLRVVR